MSFSSDPVPHWKHVLQALDPLKNLAKLLIVCTAKYAPSERIFSIAGKYTTVNTAQLSVHCYYNSEFLKKIK